MCDFEFFLGKKQNNEYIECKFSGPESRANVLVKIETDFVQECD